ncbi:MAG: hypothetical protein JRF56_15425 [Deltaproteobacteria bacterium]|nr:hypothetical protein [Deltaproteobacteria bacterium]
MIKKFTLISCLSIAVVFLVLSDFDEGKTKLLVQNYHSPVSIERNRIVSTKLASNDDMVAAVLTKPNNGVPQKTKEAKLERRPEKERHVKALVILFFMANAHKSRLYH